MAGISYVGSTNNIERRLAEHNSGKSSYTKKFIPWELIYKEECQDRKAALKREKYYKSPAGRRKIKLLFRHNDCLLSPRQRGWLSLYLYLYLK